VARHERLFVRLFALTRAAILVEAAASLVSTWRSAAHPVLIVGVVAALAAENAAVITIYARRGRMCGRRLAVGDICFGLTALVVVAALIKRSANPDTDNVLYPYTVASMMGVGMVLRRLPGVLIIPALGAGAYMTATIWRFGFSPVLVNNSMTYWVFALVSWVLTARFRGLSADLEQARRTAIARESELASARERSRYAGELHAMRMAAAAADLEQERERARLSRDLHDRVLQTLEFVGREAWISDAGIRDHVAEEAVWLRALVRGELDRPAQGLAAELDDVVAAATGAGMQIEINTAGLRAGPLPPDVTAAVRGAVTELLTNVRKHAGTCRAVLRAVSGLGRVTVTVLDHGCGFDPMRANGGLGLRESVVARIRQAGGSVVITSERGAGTHVEISVPGPDLAEGESPGGNQPPDGKVRCPANA
jgi:signal transduction histidine kinase